MGKSINYINGLFLNSKVLVYQRVNTHMFTRRYVVSATPQAYPMEEWHRHCAQGTQDRPLKGRAWGTRAIENAGNTLGMFMVFNGL